MPRIVNPGDIVVGKGRAPQGTVEDNSLRHPDRDVVPLRAHIQDPSRAHFAVAIAVEDVANNFSSDEVEGALAELAGTTSAGRLNGLLVGGGFSSVGLVLTLDTTTTVLLNGTAQDFSGDSVVLVDNAINYVYIDVSSGTLIRAAGAPVMGTEDILIAEVTTAAGVVASSRDGRWFVLNADRKPPLTVRSEGSAFNATSEANFVSLTAALLYLELYAGLGSNPMETHRIIVRGDHVISSTVVLPVSGIVFEGDGDASFTTGATVSPMFDLDGTDRVTFREIRFICDHAGCTAITDGAGLSARLTVERCRINSAADIWDIGIQLSTVTGDNIQHVIRDSDIVASNIGVEIERADNCIYENLIVSGSAAGGTVGLSFSRTFGGSVGSGRSRIEGCQVVGYQTGVWFEGQDSHLANSTIASALVGVRTGTDANRASIENTTVTLYSPDVAAFEFLGMHIQGDDSKVVECHIETARVGWGASAAIPRGIYITSAADCFVTNTKITGFTSTNGGGFFGFGIEGTTISGAHLSSLIIEGCAVGIDLDGASPTHTTNCEINDAAVGILASGAEAFISGCDILLDGTNGITGIHIETASRCQISGCNIGNSRGAYAAADLPRGIWIEGTVHSGVLISECRINNFYTPSFPGDNGYLIHIESTDKVEISGIVADVAHVGVEFQGDNVSISNSQFYQTGFGIRSQLASASPRISNVRIDLDSARGLRGISLDTSSDGVISGVVISNTRADASYGAGTTPYGIFLDNSPRMTISQCQISGFYSSVFPGAAGSLIEAQSSSNLSVSDVTASIGDLGINADSLCSDVRVSNCDMSDVRFGYRFQGPLPILSGSRATLHVDRAETGCHFGTAAVDAKVSNSHFTCPRVAWGVGDSARGITLNGQNNKASNNTVIGFNNTSGTPEGDGIRMFNDRATVADNTVKDCYRGIATSDDAEQYLVITGNRLSGCVLYGIVINESGGASGQNHYVTIVGNQIENCGSEAGISVADYREVTITGNTIRGDLGSTDYGISLTGRDIADRRVTNFVIGDNNIGGMAVAGIHLMNHTWEGTISGNQITGGLGDNVQVTADGILMETAADPMRYVTIDGNTIWNSLRGVVAAGLVGNQITNVTVSGNIIHHCAADVSPGDTFTGAGGLGVGVEFGQEFVISDNQISDIGLMLNTDGSTFAPAGPNYSAQSIYCLNCTRVTTSGNSIVSTTPGGGGLGRGISMRQRNNAAPKTTRMFNITSNSIDDAGNVMDSLIFLEVEDNLVNGAQVMDDIIVDGNACRRGAHSLRVEVGVDSTMRGLAIGNNTFDSPTFTGMNLIALAANTTLEGVAIDGNTIRDAGTDGIRVVVTLAGTIQGFTANGNTITDVVGTGISLANSATGILSSIQCNGNNILNAGTHGIAFAVAAGDMSDIQANDNIIKSPGTGGAGSAQGVGIMFLAGSGDVTEVQIHDNLINDAGTTGVAVGGVEIIAQATATITMTGATEGPPADEVTLDGTTLEGVLGAPAAGQFEILPGLDTATASALATAINRAVNGLTGRFTASSVGNVVTVTAIAVGTAGNGLVLSTPDNPRIVVTSPTAGGVGSATSPTSLFRFSICGNVINAPAETGIIALTYDGNLREFTVSNNSINRPGLLARGGISSTRGAGILFGAVEDAGSVIFDRITMVGNRLTWIGSDTGDVNSYGIGFLAVNVNLIDVMISDCQIDESPASGIFIGTLASTGGRLTNIDISDCNVKCQASASNAGATPHHGIAIIPLASAPGGPHQTLTIQGCKLRSSSTLSLSAAAAILAFPFGSADGGKFRNIHITDNILEDSTNGFLWSTFLGTGGDYTGTAAVMSDVFVSNNIIRNIDAVGVGSLMTDPSVGVGTADKRIENVRVTNNTFEACAISAITNVVIGLNWPLPAINISVEGNKLLECGNVAPDVLAPGNPLALTAVISVLVGQGTGADVGAQNISVCGNSMYMITGVGILVSDSSLASSGITSWRNLRICDNDLREISEFGIMFFPIEVGTNIYNIRIDGNSIDFTQSIDWLSNNVPGASPPPLWDSVLYGGIVVVVLGEETRNLSVSRNNIRNTVGTSTGGTAIAILLDGWNNASILNNEIFNSNIGGIVFAGAGNNVGENLQIKGNSVHTTVLGAGITVDMDLLNAVVENVHVDSNTIHSTAAEGIVVAGRATADLRNVSISDNSVAHWLVTRVGILFTMRGPTHDLSVSGNRTFHPDPLAAMAIYCDMDSTGNALINFNFSGNLASGDGRGSFRFDFDCAAENVSILGNSARCPSATALPLPVYPAPGTGGGFALNAMGGTMKGLNISHNIARNNGAFGFVVDGDTNAAAGAKWTNVPAVGPPTDWNGLVMFGNITGTTIGGNTFSDADGNFGGLKLLTTNLNGIT